MYRWTRLAPLAIALGTISACAQMCAPDQVGTGLARLTIRNVGAMASLISANDSCGFANIDVLSAPEIDGVIGGEGSVTWTASACVIDLGDGKDVSEDCKGVKTKASGKVTLSATKTVAGILTGVAANPVIPATPDSATIKITKAVFDNFEVTKSNSDNFLNMVEGEISGTMMPRLAVAADTGACAVVTSNAAFSKLSYAEGSSVIITTPDITETVPVDASDLTAQNGVRGSTENALSGSITIWGEARDVPMEGDSDGLDPDYDAAEFLASFNCDPTLADPLSYECMDMAPLLADGAARLSTKLFSAVTSAILADDSCGFSAVSVAGAPTTSASAGETGDMVFTVSGCTLDFTTATTVSTNCDAVETLLLGQVTVGGTKTVHGYITGDPTNPVIPDSDDAAVIDLTLTLGDLTVSSSADGNALHAVGGTLAGQLQPRLVLGTQGACEPLSPVARISDLTYTSSTLDVTSASGTFTVVADSSDLDLVNGTWDSDSNVLDGTISLDGQSLPVNNDTLGLDPAFDQTAFDAAWACAPGLVTPVSNDCDFNDVLANGAARLAAKAFGTITSLINADTSCGFSSMAVGGTPTFSTNVVGDQGDAVFTVASCELVFPADTLVSTDCSGTTTHVGGTVTVSGTKTVTGWLTGDPTAPVVPADDGPAEFDLTLTFSDFTVTSGDSALQVVSGTLAGAMVPRTALSTLGACEIVSPIVRFTDLVFNNAPVVMTSGATKFGFTVASSSLEAVNGTWGSDSNTILGPLSIGSDQIAIALDGTGLNPDFDQAAFDAAWACTPDLATAVTPTALDAMDCSFNTVLAQGTARMIVKAIGTASSVLDANDVCGFSALSVLTNPSAVTGTAPGPGSITWSASSCLSGFASPTVIHADCSGTTTHVDGTFTATADKAVTGFRTPTGTNPPILPTARDSATVTYSSLSFSDFVVYDLEPGATVPAASISLTGNMIGTMHPIAGELAGTLVPGSNAPVYAISTPVGGLENFTMASGTATLFSGGKTFNFALTQLVLDAFNGTYLTDSNSIAGSVRVDNAPITLPDPRLNPDFDQASFDASYVCEPGLVEPVPSS